MTADEALLVALQDESERLRREVNDLKPDALRYRALFPMFFAWRAAQ